MSHKLPSGTRFPSIGFGVYLLPPDETAVAVEKALECGYRNIDSASCYENEQECAEGIERFLSKNPQFKRSDILYTTKLWEDDYGYEKAKIGIEKSLENAKKLGYIDLMLIHSPTGGRETRLSNWKALQEFVEKGLIKNIGVSCYGVKHLEELLAWDGLKIKPSVNQIELNPWLQHTDIVDFCQSHGILVQSFSPLTCGMRLGDPELLALSAKYHKSPAQILLKWNTQKGIMPLPKSVQPERIKMNIDLDDFELSKEDLDSLGDKDSYFVTVPSWDPTKEP